MLRVRHSSGRKLTLDQAKFIDMGALSNDFFFTTAAWPVRRVITVSLVDWLKHGPENGI